MNHILYQRIKIILSISSKNINITFKIKQKHYIWNENNEANSWSNEIRSTKSEITKNKNGKNISHIEITEAGLFHCIYWTIIMN